MYQTVGSTISETRQGEEVGDVVEKRWILYSVDQQSALHGRVNGFVS